MLTVKKISTKKIIIYIVVIISMLGGAMLLLSKFYFTNLSATAPAAMSANQPTSNTQPLTATKIDMSLTNSSNQTSLDFSLSSLDIGLFEDKKFLNLKADVIYQPNNNIAVGKENPFIDESTSTDSNKDAVKQ